MKTFDEAIKSTCLAKTKDVDSCEAVKDKQLKSMSIISEVCESWEAEILAQVLINNMKEDNPLPEEFMVCIKNAIAQGVLIGMEMEKVE